MSEISKIDKNFEIAKTETDSTTRFYDSLLPPFEIDGIFYENGKFRRLPEATARSVSGGLVFLHSNTAGGKIRFQTDSPYVVVNAKMLRVGKMSHFALCGSAGFDLYVKNEYVASALPPFDIQDGYQGKFNLGTAEMREITIHFPLYSDVTELSIGLEEHATLLPPPRYARETPIVFYGSSITQGGCASRPGNAYPAMVARHFDSQHINLGFSGNAKGEVNMANHIASLSMSAFVLDYDHNAPSTEHLRATHEPFFKIIRKAHPTLPILILSRPKFYPTEEELERLAIVRKTYENALLSHDSNVYFISGKELMQIAQNDGTVDGCHPNDLGFFSMAQAVIKVLQNVL